MAARQIVAAALFHIAAWWVPLVITAAVVVTIKQGIDWLSPFGWKLWTLIGFLVVPACLLGWAHDLLRWGKIGGGATKTTEEVA